MKFKELRKVLSRIDLLSICDYKTLQYYNYVRLSDVPADYDEMEVKGVGLTRSEFYGVSRDNCCTDRKAGPLLFEICLEILLSDE